MANDQYLASEVLFLEANFGDEATPDWKKLVCLSEKSFNASTGTTEIATDCNDGFTITKPAKKSWDMSWSGYASVNPDLEEGSYADCYDLWDSRTETDFRIRNVDDSYYREGKGFISTLSESSSQGDYLQFSGTITGQGRVLNAPQT